MDTAATAKPLPGESLYQRRATIVLPLLVRKAKAAQTVQYGQLAKEAGIPNPRHLNHVLACIGQTLIGLSREWQARIPPIQCLVVSKATGLPSSGIGPFMVDGGDFHKLTRSQQRAVFASNQKKTFAYRRWVDVLEALGLEEKPFPFSTSDYQRALARVQIAPHHKRMLAVHLHAPQRTLTATQMAHALGYSSYRAANIHYGTLGRLVCKVLGWAPLPRQTVASLAKFQKRQGEWHWILRAEVAHALEDLGWGTNEQPCLPEEVHHAEPHYEGAVRTIKVNAYERNSAAREECVRHHGCSCTVCGIALADQYGEAAQGLIHVHHLRPLAARGARYRVDPIQDLRPVCPTCHAVIHVRNPPFTIDEVKQMMALARKRQR